MVKDVDALKKKVTKEFISLLCDIKKGYKLDYEFILEEISFIDLIQNNEIDEIITIEENKTEENKNLTPIIKYEYDIKIKRIVTKHIIYPDVKKNITKYPVTYGNNIKILIFCHILSIKLIYK